MTAGERLRDTSFSNTSGCGRITRLSFMFRTRSFAEPTPTESSTARRPRTSRGPSCICSQTSMTKNGFTGAWTTNTRFSFQPTKVANLISHAMRSPGIDGLLFCRCRALLSIPRLTLHPHKVKNLFGDVYLERKGWWQIWIHQIMRAKVLRHLFKHLPDHIPSAKAMDDLKDDVPKLPEHRLFVTEKNYAVFGESTRRGMITQNCYESIVDSGIELPEWFQQPNGEYVTLGKL